MDKYGLIGYPLGHSFSKNYFNEKFENEGIDAQYINFEIPSIENLTEILDSNPELKGLNVTIPYKEKVISYLEVDVLGIEHNFMNEPGQTMPEITDEYAESVSDRYIELYEHITGEKFDKAAEEGDIAARIEKNVSEWLAAHK